MNEASLRQSIRKIIEESMGSQRVLQKKLRVFDFDDTLVKTKSLIHVTTESGAKFDLTPGEFAVYESMPGDDFDFSDFDKLIDPQEIKWTVRILRSITQGSSEVVILTARAIPTPVQQFLREAELPPIEIIALGDANPRRKSEYIESRILNDGFDFIEFFDDSYKNIAAVKALAALYPEVKIRTRHVVHNTDLS